MVEQPENAAITLIKLTNSAEKAVKAFASTEKVWLRGLQSLRVQTNLRGKLQIVYANDIYGRPDDDLLQGRATRMRW